MKILAVVLGIILLVFMLVILMCCLRASSDADDFYITHVDASSAEK